MDYYKKQAEETAEAFAIKFLEDLTGYEIFLGSHIEKILADRAIVVYQYVEDESYFGAAINYQSGEQFIALNTFHPLRMRYFTAAHEIWHLSEASQLQGEMFDHERAADRFAAAVMLPKASTIDLWSKFKRKYGSEKAVIYLADLAAVPYRTVVRRLKELGETIHGVTLSEEYWIEKRSEFDLPESNLDAPQKFEKFSAYEKIVGEALSQGRLTTLTAANKIVRFDPTLAENLQKEEMERLKEAENNET